MTDSITYEMRSPDLAPPQFAYGDGACFYLHYHPEPDEFPAGQGVVWLDAGEQRRCSTGIRFEIPRGYEIQIRSRHLTNGSGLAVLHQPNIIDCKHRGWVEILIWNSSKSKLGLFFGDKIAQAVVYKIPSACFKQGKVRSVGTA